MEIVEPYMEVICMDYELFYLPAPHDSGPLDSSYQTKSN